MKKVIFPLALILAGCETGGSSSSLDRAYGPEELVCRSMGFITGSDSFDTCVDLAFTAESVAGIVNTAQRHNKHKKKHHNSGGYRPAPTPGPANSEISESKAIEICDSAIASTFILMDVQRTSATATGGYEKTVRLEYLITPTGMSQSSSKKRATGVCVLHGHELIKANSHS